MPRHELSNHGLSNTGEQHWNLSAPVLYERIIQNREASIARHGPVVARTGVHTGRSPNDKFIVKDASSADRVSWGDVNRPYDEERFDAVLHRVTAYLQGKDVYIRDCYAGAHPRYRRKIRVITETAWHNLFAKNMFLEVPKDELADFVPDTVLFNVPGLHALPEVDAINSKTFILVHFKRGIVLVGGTSYAGEIKKSVFTMLNYVLPGEDVMPMHCSANMGEDGQTALFFGLSGTGKTTLSADPKRSLIGDDEHGWAQDGIFNFEGGCYAKVIRLSETAEPEIYQTTRTFGTILENVVFDPETRDLDLDDGSLTENTRAAYPLTQIPNALPAGVYPHPKNLIMLTCDAFGVMPPIAKMSTGQALYHFLSGYTAKVAGTEKGLSKEPQATFSTCFGAPFMVLPPSEYARLLKKYLDAQGTHCWLVNTGWSGGPYGVGERMKIEYTRALVAAALDGSLAKAEFVADPIFGVQVPKSLPGVPDEILIARNTWSDKEAYDRKARDLAARFKTNYKQFQGEMVRDVEKFAPKTD